MQCSRLRLLVSPRDKRSGRRWQAAAILALVAVGAASVVLAQREDGSRESGAGAGHPSFAELAAANTNRCDLGAAELRSMPPSMHLRGSCCQRMDRAHYRDQLDGLRRYRELRRVIAADPYDVSVALAERLLAYRGVPLSQGERAAYRAAAEDSQTGGPCCCRCWRWQAFRGQGRYLLHRRGFSAPELARVWDLEEGCGGPGESA
jgi:hypothetical protein